VVKPGYSLKDPSVINDALPTDTKTAEQ